MDITLAKYIVRYYSELFTGEEKLLLEHAYSYPILTPETLAKIIKDMGWVEKLSDAESLFDNKQKHFRVTNDEFDRLVATKLMEKYKDQIVLNYCAKCGNLARTPMARQCRCGNKWFSEQE